MKRLILLLTIILSLGDAGPGSASEVTQREVQFEGVRYPFAVFVPSSYDGRRALPAVLLIHGAGGNGPDMIAAWRSFAERHNIILAAPTVSLTEAFEAAVAPQLYPAIMEGVRAEWKLDARRIYLFGFSAGGYSVFSVGLGDSRYFAAGGVFACVITPDYDAVVKTAARKTPFAIYIGDRDRFFTVAQAQRTRDMLQSNGFPVRFLVLANFDHDYGAAAGLVNADVWSFFSQHPLP